MNYSEMPAECARRLNDQHDDWRFAKTDSQINGSRTSNNPTVLMQTIGYLREGKLKLVVVGGEDSKSQTSNQDTGL